VVYFNADAEDIDTEDTQYTDILLACTRQLLKTLNEVNSKPLLNWLKNCWDDLKDVMSSKIEIDKISIKSGELPKLFASLTADLRAIPTQRSKIREKVNPHTVTLLKALNEFINNANNSLPNNKKKLAIIVDSLDRIVPILRDKDTGKTNYDEIFIDRSEQLKKEEAIASYDHALKINPDYEQAWNNKACLYALNEESQLALECLEKAIKLNPKYLQMAKTDSDFDLIQELPQFKALINQN
jgi:tetratricopeptide (TPR) repeat protein